MITTRLRAEIKAGASYFIAVLLVAFILGIIRVLVLMPHPVLAGTGTDVEAVLPVRGVLAERKRVSPKPRVVGAIVRNPASLRIGIMPSQVEA